MLVGDFGSVALEGAHPVSHLVGDGLVQLVSGVPGRPEVHQLHVEFAVQQNVLAFDVAVGDVSAVQVPQGRKQLSEDGPGCLF